jgi:TonB family protein
LKRSTGFLPLRIYQLHVALGYGTLPLIDSFVRSEPRPGETIKKMRNRKVNDVEAECVEMITEEKIPREVCVDSATKTLVRPEGFRDSGLAPVGPKLSPRFLSYQEQKTTLAEVHVTELQAGDKNPASMFEPPPGAASKSGCMNPVPGRRTVKVAPKYPEPDRAGHVQGTVSVYTLIGTAGIPRNVKVVYGVSPTLDESSLTAVQQWRYEPATCDGKPVETETVITVHYTLGG